MITIISDSREGGIADYSERLAEELGDKAIHYKPSKGIFGKLFFYLKLPLVMIKTMRNKHTADIQCMIWPVLAKGKPCTALTVLAPFHNNWKVCYFETIGLNVHLARLNPFRLWGGLSGRRRVA